jgi:hypothetical protein
MAKKADDATFNGWKNYETWNVSLWLLNNEYLYSLVQDLDNYQHLKDVITTGGTPDGISWYNAALDTEALDKLFKETR